MAAEYRRQPADLTEAADGVKTSATDVFFPEPAKEWGTVVAAGIYDEARGGNQLAWDYLDEPMLAVPRRIAMIPRGGLRIGIIPASGADL